MGNFLMVRLSPLAMNVSVLLKLSSNHPSWVWNLLVSMRLDLFPSWSVILTSERISSPTLSCLVAPPCMLVLLIVCRRKSLLLLLQPLRSRSLLPLSVNTQYGSVAPSCLHCPPSRLCGSPRRNTKNPAQELFTANASKKYNFLHSIVIVIVTSYIYMSGIVHRKSF